MSASKPEDKLYKAIDHPIRRQIIQIIAENPKTYSRLLEDLNIESGHLAYHIRILSELLDKDETGNFILNSDGKKAYSFLMGEERKVVIRTTKKSTIIAMVILVIIAGASILWISNRNRLDELRFNEKKEETYTFSLQALDIVYSIFEDWEIPRDHWAELLLKIVEIKSNLNELYDQSEQENFLKFAERLEHYEIELSNVIIVGDPGYMTLTVEKRYFIRELHTLLLEIEEAL